MGRKIISQKIGFTDCFVKLEPLIEIKNTKHNVDDNNKIDEAMVQNKVTIKNEIENYDCENIELIQTISDFDEVDIKNDPIEHSNDHLEIQMSKCHICDMKYKNWNSHFFQIPPTMLCENRRCKCKI